MPLSNEGQSLPTDSIARAAFDLSSKTPPSFLSILRSIGTNPSEIYISSYVYDFDNLYANEIIADTVEPSILEIGRRVVDGVGVYFSISDQPPGESVSPQATSMEISPRVITIDFAYDLEELSELDFGAPFINPSFDFVIKNPENPYYVNTIKNDEITYDSLSLIGSINVEQINVTIDQNLTETITFNEQSETITDTGGPSVAARETRSFDTVSSTGTSTTSTATVTSGRTGY